MSTIKVVYDPSRGLYQEYGEPSFIFMSGSSVGYTPADSTNWNPVPTNLVQAVDYLADATQSTSLVFDPNDTATGNVYNDLDGLAAAVGRIKGKKTILFKDSSDVLTYTIANGTQGPYDFSDCEFLVTQRYNASFGSFNITFGPGVVFSKLPNKFVGPGQWYFPANFWSSTALPTELVVSAAKLLSTPGVTAAAAFNVLPSHALTLYLQNSAALEGAVTASKGLFNIGSTAYTEFTLSEQSTITDYVFTGAGTTRIIFTDELSAVANQTLPLWTSTLFFTTPFVAPMNYVPGAYSNTGNTFKDWESVYNIAKSQGGDAIIRCTGFTNATNIPSGAYDMTGITLDGLPGYVLYISNGVTMSGSTNFRVKGNLKVVVSSSVDQPVFRYDNPSTRVFEFTERSRLVNESTIPFISASNGAIILTNVEGPSNSPVTQGNAFAKLDTSATLTFSGTRPMQSVIEATGALVSFNIASEAQLVCTADGAGTGLLADIEGNAYLRIPQYSTFIVEGVITARGRSSGTTNSGIWSFRTVLTRDVAANTVAVVSGGGAATVISAGTYATPPNIAADTTNGGVKITCTGTAGFNSVFVANVKITTVGTGA
jgi:hypothetical protein